MCMTCPGSLPIIVVGGSGTRDLLIASSPGSLPSMVVGGSGTRDLLIAQGRCLALWWVGVEPVTC